MAYAEAQRTANVSDRALAEAARDAAAGIDVQAQAMANAGTEQERMAARAKAMQEAEARAANQAREAAQAAHAQEINLKQLLAQIDPTIAALNRLAEMEDKLEKAQEGGLINESGFTHYQGRIDAMRQSVLDSRSALTDGADAMNGYGMSARQTSNAMRMVPAQITDITTSLISGQPAWQVVIQQGGQLFDMFGGSIPALRAVGTTILGMINPLTVSAAAVVALGAAWQQAQGELYSFQLAMVQSGHNADISAAQFAGLVAEIDKLAGVSRGQAVTALNAVAGSSEFTGKQFLMVAEAAARMESATGRSAEQTVAAFESIADNPVDALARLDKAERFLTRAQIDRIMTLQDEAKEQQAVDEALLLFDQHLKDVANTAETHMPAMSRWWRELKNEVSGAWGEVQTYATLLDGVIAKHGIAERLDFSSGFSKSSGLIGAVASMLPDGWASGVNNWAKGALASAGGSNGLPTPVFGITVTGEEGIEDYVKLLKENKAAEDAASEALTARLAGLDRVASKQEAIKKIVELYNQIPKDDARHFDGSMQRLIAQSNAQVDKQFNQREGVGKANTDDNAAQSFIANVQRQITANEQLADSGDKVSASDRLVIQARQLLADKTNTMTAASKQLLQAMIPQLQASDVQAEKAKQAQRNLVAQAALTERLAQLEKQRQEQSDVDLMSIGRGADATQMLQRQLDIQREYLREREKLEKDQRGRNPLSAEAYQSSVSDLESSLARSLDIERNYQQQRIAMLGDWRTGARRVWDDYAFSAANASETAASALTNGLSAAEDAFVRFVQTGKLSFSSLAKSILADLARIAARQAIVGAVGSIVGSLAGGAAGSWTGTSASAGSNLNFGNNVDSFTGNSWASFGGGRASGGDVSNSSMYEVGEFDRPEIFNDRRGRSYLIPGNDGTVVPMHRLASGNGGGSATPTFNVSINTVVQSDGSSSTSATAGDDNAMGRALAKLIEPEVKRVLVQQMRPGGLLVGAR